MGAAIKFKTVRFQNLFSYGNNVSEVDLSSPQLHLIVGESGAGKSTILDAIMFALFGKPYKKVVKGSITNSINGKNTMVEIVFETGGSSFLVRRGIKPNVFEIEKDGEMLDRDAKALDMQKSLENNILGGITASTFLQTAIIGTANFVPFMQLPLGERRKMVEMMLSLSIFSRSAEITKRRIKIRQEERAALFSDKRVIDSSLHGLLNTLDVLLRQKTASESSDEEIISSLREEIEMARQSKTAKLQNIQEIKNNLLKTKQEIGQIEDTGILTQEGQKGAFSVKSLQEKIALWDKGACPTCGQTLSKDSNKTVFDYERAVLDVVETKKLLEDLRGRITVSKQQQKTLDDMQIEGKAAVTVIQNLSRDIERSESTLQVFLDKPKKSFDPKSLQTTEEGILLARAESEDKQGELDIADEDVKYLKMCSELFKDGGIKANIVKVFIPLLNKTINEYLEEFELDVMFEFDEEFNETIKGRGRDDYSYNNLSEGEKRRVDLAILFSWLKIGELKNSANMNLLCADEIMDASLDFASVQNLVKIMQRLIRESGKSIFVISHREELKDAFFDKVLVVKKEGQFSNIEEVGKE